MTALDVLKTNEVDNACSKTGLLKGVRVLDMTTVVLGPVAGMVLGDLGADVIKIEPPGGDTARGMGPHATNGMGAVFLTINRNKRSVVLNLKDTEDKRRFDTLVQTADVFIHNMRPKAAEKLGLSYERLKVLKADLIYCASYGYQAQGPYGDKAAYDDLIQAGAGLASMQAEAQGAPVFIKGLIADKVTGLYVALSIGMALFYRERRKAEAHRDLRPAVGGQAIEVPMFETMTAFNAMEHLYGLTHVPSVGAEGYTRARSKYRRPHKTKDGYIAVLPYVDKQWKAFFEVAGKPELMADPLFKDYKSRLAKIDEVYERLGELMLLKNTEEWLEALDARSVPVMRVNGFDDLIDDPHLEATGFWQIWEDSDLGAIRMPSFPVTFSAETHQINRRAPYLGEHNEEIFSEIRANDSKTNPI